MATLAFRDFFGSVVSAGGTGNLTIGADAPGRSGLADIDPGVAAEIDYVIFDGSQIEWGTGTVNSAGTTFTRDTISGTVASDGTRDETSPAALDIGVGAKILWMITSASAAVGYGASMNQGVATTDSPTFAGLTLTKAGVLALAMLNSSAAVGLDISMDADAARLTAIAATPLGLGANGTDDQLVLNVDGTITAAGGGSLTGTWSDLGSVTTIDINGGTIDGTVIGGSVAAAGSFTTLNASGNATVVGDVYSARQFSSFGGTSAVPALQVDSDGGGGAIGLFGSRAAASEFLGIAVGGVEAVRWNSSLAATFAGNANFQGNNIIDAANIYRTGNASTTGVSGGSSRDLGGNFLGYGENHGSKAGYWELRDDTSVKFAWNGTNLTANGNSLVGVADLSLTGMVNLGTPATLTCSADTITVTKSNHRVSGQGAAADDLSTINGGSDGDIICLKCTSSTMAITVKHGVGNIYLNGSADFILASERDKLWLQYDGDLSEWHEIGRGDNG